MIANILLFIIFLLKQTGMFHFFQKPPINENQVGGFGNWFYPDIFG